MRALLGALFALLAALIGIREPSLDFKYEFKFAYVILAQQLNSFGRSFYARSKSSDVRSIVYIVIHHDADEIDSVRASSDGVNFVLRETNIALKQAKVLRSREDNVAQREGRDFWKVEILRKRIRVGFQYATATDVSSRRVTVILHSEPSTWPMRSIKARKEARLGTYIGAQFLPGERLRVEERTLGDLVSFASQPQSPENGESTQSSDDRRESRNDGLCYRNWVLGFGSLSGATSGGRRVALSLQIIGIMLVGAIFAIVGALGLLLVFDNPNRNLKLWGAGLSGICFPITLALYSWAWLGHPLAVLGLCERL